MTFSNLFRTFLTLTSSVVPAEISALIAQTDVELLHESRRGGATDVRTAVVPTAHINCRGQIYRYVYTKLQVQTNLVISNSMGLTEKLILPYIQEIE